MDSVGVHTALSTLQLYDLCTAVLARFGWGCRAGRQGGQDTYNEHASGSPFTGWGSGVQALQDAPHQPLPTWGPQVTSTGDVQLQA